MKTIYTICRTKLGLAIFCVVLVLGMIWLAVVERNNKDAW